MAITRYLKIGEESEFGTEASAYDETLDPETADMESEDDDKLIYEGMSGLDRLAKVGTYSTSGSITVPHDDKIAGWFWKWALGGYDAPVETEAPYTHSFYPQKGALMTSFSAKVGKDIMEHVFLGNIIDSIELEMDSEWALMTVNTVGAKDEEGVLDDAVEFTEGDVFTAPMASLTKGETDVSAKVHSLSLSVETGANVTDSAGFGSRYPRRGYQGSLVVNMELTLGFYDKEELEIFWGGASGPAENKVQEVDYTLSLGENVDFIFPRMIYTSANQPADGRDYIEQTVNARALYDPSSQEGPILVSITNEKDTYVKS